MAIDLANVNLTIRQFQEISSGKYNAGEVRLATGHSLGKINHHVGMTGLNKVSISHAETLAVKDAFIRALSQNGVAADELDRVRKELGLAPDGAVDTALAQRSIRPLTREQIRAILDRNADTINQANNGQEIIRTEAQLHERFSERERADIVRTRNQANAALMQRRALLPDRRIVDAQNVIAGNIHYCDKAERERLITAAERQRACILDGSHGNPSNAPGATMVFQVPGTGQTLTLSLGMSEADYLKKLDDMLLVLRGDRHPSDAVLEVRNEFRTLAAQGRAALARWVASLANDPQGAFKARTIAVSLLFDGGVADWETLSLVNRISDFAAIALVSHLVNHRDPDLRGDALRQSAAVASLAQQIDPQAVPAANQTYIPALSPREAKSAAYDALYHGGKTPTHEMKTMADEILAEFRSRFGAVAVPEGVKFRSIVPAGVFEAAAGCDTDIRKSIADVKADIVAGAANNVARRYLQEFVKPLLTAAGGRPTDSTAVVSALFSRHPGLKNLLVAANSPDEARQIVDDFRGQIESCIRRQVTASKFRVDAVRWFREEIASELGVDVAAFEGARTLNVMRFGTKSGNLLLDICTGDNAADTDLEIEQAFRAIAQEAAQERIALLREADALPVSPEVRDILKEQVLRLDKVTGFTFAALKEKADRISVSKLATLLSANAPVQEVVAEMSAIGTLVSNAAIAFYAGHAADGDEIGAASNIMVALALDKTPGILDLMRAFFMRPEVAGVDSLVHLDTNPVSRAVAFEMFKPQAPFAATNAALADAIGKPGMPPLAAQALNLAFKDLGLGNLSAEQKAKLLGGIHGRSLVTQVRNSANPVTPALLRAMARGAFIDDAVEPMVRSILSQAAEQNGCRLSAPSIDSVMGVLTRREPDLLAKIKTAIARAAAFNEDLQDAVDRILTSYYDAVDTTIRAFHEIEAVNASSKDTVVREIAVRANLDEETVRAKLNTRPLALEFSGSLNILRNTVRDELANPNTDPAAYNVQDVAERANERVERFIAKKAAFIAEIDTLPLSDAAKGNLIVRTLEQPTYTNAEYVAYAREISAAPEVQAAFAMVRKAFSPASVAIMTDAELFRTLEFFTKTMDKVMENVLPQDRQAGMDAGDIATIRQLVTFTMMDFCGATLTSALEILARDGRFETLRAAGSAITEEYNAAYLNAAAPMPPGPGLPAPAPDPVAAAAAERSLSSARAASNVIATITDALADEWLPADVADAFHSEIQGVAVRVNAALKHAPTLFARYAGGMNEDERVELKSFVITLDYRANALAATEEAIKAKAREIKIRGEGGFDVADSHVAQAALAMGYAPAELPMLKQAADIYRAATGCTQADANIAVINPNSPARRLFAFGGRFTASAENFRKGLALMEDFKVWFAGTTAAVAAKSAAGGVPPQGANATVFNSDTNYLVENASYAFEKFIFEEIAINEAIPLEAEDKESIFGMESNAAMRFVGRGFTNAMTNTLANLPREMRQTVYKVFDIVIPLASDAQTLKNNIATGFNVTLYGRIMRNFDQIIGKIDDGTLTRENFLEEYFPDVPNAKNMTVSEISRVITDRVYYEVIPQRFNGNYAQLAPISDMMNASGRTVDETADAILAGQSLKAAPYTGGFNGGIKEFDGTARGGRAQAVKDMLRPAIPQRTDGSGYAIPEANNVFKVVFPDGTTLKSSSSDEANAIADKVAEFCGDVHPLQLNSVYFSLTQAAESEIVNKFLNAGIETSEHAPLTYTFSRNEETGAITIRYSEPDGFPRHFHWETVVAIDGTATSTNIVVG